MFKVKVFLETYLYDIFLSISADLNTVNPKACLVHNCLDLHFTKEAKKSQSYAMFSEPPIRVL